MNARFYTVALLIIGLSFSAFVAPDVAASTTSQLRIAPGEPYGLPKFGFSSSTIPGYGQRIEFVRPGGRAARMGLEPGDVILSLNGHRLTHSGSWNDALSRALYEDGGFVQLRVRDVRTGLVRVRSTRIGFGGGPIEHHLRTGVSVSPHFSITAGGIHITR
jgi:PDZ domain